MRISFAVVVILFGITSIAQAQSQTQSPYASIGDIPSVLRKSFRDELFREQYIERTLSVLRRSAADHINLGNADIEKMQRKNEDQQKRQQIQHALSYDMDFDAIVTRDEVEKKIREDIEGRSGLDGQAQEEHIRKLRDQVMGQDTDNDGKITLAEMSVVKDVKRGRHKQDEAEELIALDPDGNGTLTAAELEDLALRAFATADVNHDGMLATNEVEQIQQMNRAEQQIERLLDTNCNLAKAAPDEKIVVIGGYEGKTVSSVTVAGQTHETDAVPLHIGEGTERLYIIAATHNPAIWQVTGNTARVSRFLIGAPDSEGKITAGQTGIAKERTAFFDVSQCRLAELWEESRRGYSGGEKISPVTIIEKIAGARPVSVASAYSLLRANIEGTTVAIDEGDKEQPASAPKGFDEKTWQTHVMFMPGGVASINVKDVISDAPAAAYEVLPKYAGIAKLVHEGTLTPLSGHSGNKIIDSGQGMDIMIGGGGNDIIIQPGPKRKLKNQILPEGYTVNKDIPYFPAGLYGGYATKFVLAKGVKMPKGELGHSNISCEDVADCAKAQSSPLGEGRNPACLQFKGCVDGSDSFKFGEKSLTHKHMGAQQIGDHDSCMADAKVVGGGYFLNGKPVRADQEEKTTISIKNFKVLSGRGEVIMSEPGMIVIDDMPFGAAATYELELCP